MLISTAIILFVSAGASFAYQAYVAMTQPTSVARPVAFGGSVQALPGAFTAVVLA
jgi:hypothetical protein